MRVVSLLVTYFFFCGYPKYYFCGYASGLLEEVSSIDWKGWDVLKLATALKMVCYPNDEIVFGNPHKVNCDSLRICSMRTCHSIDKLKSVYFRCLPQMSFQSLSLMHLNMKIFKGIYFEAL